MKTHPHEHLDPLQVLGVSDKANPEAVSAAYAELSVACRHGPEQLALLRWAYDQILQREVAGSVLSSGHSELSAEDERDGVVTALLIPGFSEEPSHTRTDRQNIIELPMRTGATADDNAAEQAPERLPASTDQRSWVTPSFSGPPKHSVETQPKEPSAPRSRPADLECLLGMSEFEESPSLPSNDDEDVLEHLIMREEYVALLKPKLRRSLIGEGEKEIVSTRAAGTRNTQVVQSVESLLQNTTDFSGQLLKSIRELHGVELSEVSARTKVHLRHLVALEADQLNQLPALVYFRGFVDSYLKYFGINHPPLVNRFIERYLQARNGSTR